MNVPDRKAACLEQARIFREKAEADPVNRERWLNEAINWLERAAAPCGQVVVTIEDVPRLPEESG
ncbi:MAG: hypothetical protein KGJ00_17260 [Bradyrhizobium sp.]|nr:hypothetical protein [Bradyrhizobium sp.]